MYDINDIDPAAPAPRRRSRTGLKIALVGAGIAAGAIGATAIGASATTSGSGTATSGTAATSSTGTAAPGAPSGAPSGPPKGAPPAGARGGNHGAPGETVVTGANAATLKAAALKAVPGATVDRVETDSGDAKYEVHMTKSDGSKVTVKFDANLEQTAVESGMGK